MEAPRPHMPAQRPLMVVLFLLLAASTQLLLALYGLLSRFVQVKPSPPLPALRLVVVCNLIGEAALVAFHLAPLLLARLWRRWRQGEGVLELPLHAPRREALRSAAGNTAPCAAPAKQTADSSPSESIIVGGDGSSDSSDGQPCINTNALQPPAAAKAEPPAPAHSSVRAPVPLVRGMTFRMERWQQRRPEAHRRLALAAIVASFTGVCSLQILAPGFVDVSIVQLTTQWTTLAIALTQALLLRHHLPRAFWPCAAAMLAGACMVIIPSVGQSTVGSLNTVRGWMGFLMAVGALISTVIYYCLLQATRHLGFSALQLQHLMNTASILLFLCLSLPVDGASWAGQFDGWVAQDWLALVGLSTVSYLGSGMLMQVCVWKLGAPTAAMFFGLRLVFSVVLSQPMLGATVIQTGVQIGGVVITAVAVTCYAGSQWWVSHQLAQQAQQQQPEQHVPGKEEHATSFGRDTAGGPSASTPPAAHITRPHACTGHVEAL